MRLRKRPRERAEGSRIDRAVMPFFGPAQIGPYDDKPVRDADESESACPTCGVPYSQHTIDRSSGNSFITCP